jgi:protein ImuB
MELRRRRLQKRGAWQPHSPFVIAAQEGSQRIVVAVNDMAARFGIVPGITLSRARVIHPEVKAAPARPHADARALDKLAVRALRYSPLVAPCPPDGLWIDATGAAHLFGGETDMVWNITQRLRAAGITARTAMAGTPGAAWAWARFGTIDPVLVPGAEKSAIDPLPLAALRLPAATLQSMRHVGLKTIGDLKRMPRATLPMRFGKEVLTRLDQATGFASEAIAPILPPAAKRRTLQFAEPIGTPEDLQRVIDLLTRQLCDDLDDAHEGARKLDLVFARTDGAAQMIRLGTARPSRDAKHLAKLLGEKLATVDPGFGIESATLTAWRTEILEAVQLDTHGSAADTARDLGELVDRLANRLGGRNVFKIAAVASDIPERAGIAADPLRDPLRAATVDTWPRHWPRPARLFAAPEPVNVIALLPDYPPAKFRWRDEMHTVRTADGPERIFGTWWNAAAEAGETRDYFRVENERGERYWMFRKTRPGDEARWYVHGVFA